MTVLVAVVLAGFFGVMDCMQVMAVGHVSMVPALFVTAGFMMLGSREMVLRGVPVVLGGFAVVIRNLFRHLVKPPKRCYMPRVTTESQIFDEPVSARGYSLNLRRARSIKAWCVPRASGPSTASPGCN